MQNHLIVCGLGHVGYRIVELLHELGETFVVVTRDIRPEWRETITARAAQYVEGDARSAACLREAGIETARALFIVTDSDLINIEIALDAQRLNPKLRLIVRVFDRYLADRIGRSVGAHNVLSPAMLTAPVFIAAALGEEIARVFNIGGCHLNVLRLDFVEATAPGIGETVQDFCAPRNLIPLALHPRPTTSTESSGSDPLSDEDLDRNAAPGESLRNRRLTVGDELIVAACDPATEKLRLTGLLPRKTTIMTERWGQKLWTLLRRPLHPIKRIQRVWRRSPQILRAAVLGLLCLILISIIVLHNTMPELRSWTDTLYFVTSIMTTIGFGDYNFRHAPWWLKLYGCGVMITGATLVAIFYGIITDYIVAARVEQALGRRHTNLKNHIVVIGLGDVGTRVAEELQRMGEPVIAIERTPEHEALPALQDQIQVIVADANRDSTLRQANITQARAIILTTTDDLDSLRIAHQAELLNPKLRSVVRIYDSALAQKLGGGLGIERAVNAAETAAATFVACAFEEGVEQGFRIGSRLLLLCWRTGRELLPQWRSGLTAQELRDLGFAALLRRTGNGDAEKTLPLGPHEILTPSDRLLILEEYRPERGACLPPEVNLSSTDSYTDSFDLNADSIISTL